MRSISTDYSQNLQQKVSCFLIVLSLSSVESARCCRPLTAVWPSFPVNVNASLVPILARQSYVLTTQRSQIAFFPRTFSVGFSVLAAVAAGQVPSHSD